ncbi:MAG: CvpA family protein [Betaproteobacteria bacterium]|nr:CvpA family protein [Betaproteobacteria bacterium]
MNELDYAIVALLVLSVIVGCWRGAIREVLNMAGWVLAFIVAHAYAGDLARQFSEWAVDPALRLIVAWLVIFLIVMALVSLLASLLSGWAHKLGLGPFDRVLGGVIGFLRGLLVLLALTWVAGLTKIPQSPMWRAAASTHWLEIAALYARNVLPDGIAARIHYRISDLHKA